MIDVIEAREPTDAEIRRSLAKAADRVREWVDGRLDDDARDIARLYRSARDKMIERLRRVYEDYLRVDPTITQARLSGAMPVIDQSIDLTISELADYLGTNATHAMQSMLGHQPTVLRRHMRRVAWEDLPYSASRVLDELTTRTVGGGTFFDHLFNVTDKLKRDVISTSRTALVNGYDFDMLRDRMMNVFGVDKLADPTSNAYGAVKVYKNSARREWNLLMGKQARAHDAETIWWAVLDDDTTPGCAARHGFPIEDDGPPRHINCFVPDTRVEGQFLLGTRMLYRGRVVRLKTRQGHTLTVTPNHPILTERGMRSADLIREGDHVMRRVRDVEAFVHDQQHVPAKIQETFDAIRTRGYWQTAQTTRDDFHGDATSGDSKVDVVAFNRELLHDFAESTKRFDRQSKLAFVSPDTSEIAHRRARPRDLSAERVGAPASSLPCRAELTIDEIASPFYSRPLDALCVGSTVQLDAAILKTSREHGARDTAFVAQMLDRFPTLVALDEIVEYASFDFDGHVYDLQSVSGCIVAESIVVSNCRCTILVADPDMDLSLYQQQGMDWLKRHHYSRRSAELEESWHWGTARLASIARTNLLRESDAVRAGYRYQSVPIRSLPLMLVSPATGTWSRHLHEVLARANSDHVLLRRLTETQVNTREGWRPLAPSHDEPLIETVRGFAIDSVERTPVWDEVRYVRAAVACFEPGGLVWAVRPRGTYVWTLPGGGVKDEDEGLRATAAREMLEETGLRVEITSRLGVLDRGTSVSVIFKGERIGERENVRTPEEIDAVMPVSVAHLVDDERRFLAIAFREASFDPAEHPRVHGRFAPKGGGTAHADNEPGAIAKTVGAKFNGIQDTPWGERFVVITDNTTGSTAMIPFKQFSRGSAQAAMNRVRKNFATHREAQTFLFDHGVLEAFDPGKHPRDKWGRFGHGAGPSTVTIGRAGERTYTGAPRATRTKISKQKAGKIGENIGVEYLKSLGSKDATLINTDQPNFALDAVHDHEAVEFKTGLISNTVRAQQWRLTLGQPGKEESAWLKSAPAATKAKWNASKGAKILARKTKAIHDIERETGIKLKSRTITMILDPDRKTADVYSFQGFHSRIGWNSPEAQKAFVKTVKFE